jgi:hypothetical protein
MKRQAGNELSEFFGQAALEAFRFLIDEHGYEHASTTSYANRECTVKFRGRLANVSTWYEVFSPPWTSIERLDREYVQDVGIQYLMEERCPELLPAEDAEDGGFGNSPEEVRQVLQLHARVLREYGRDLLEGDFRIFPRLRQRQAVAMREQNRRLFGTSTGETPRFDFRPSLEQLFASGEEREPPPVGVEAANSAGIPAQTWARIYQAFWDYEYSVAQIAEFLNISREQVQESLNEWDELD